MLNKLQLAWPIASQSDDSLASLLRDVGHAFTSLDSDSLRDIRNYFAKAKVMGERAEGMLMAAVELLDGYRDAQNEIQRKAEAEHEVRKPLHVKLLRMLELKPTTPSDMAKSLGERPTDVSSALKKLRTLGLVHEPVRSETDARVRQYHLTPRGRAMAATLESSAFPEPASEARAHARAAAPPSGPHLGYDSSQPLQRASGREYVESLTRRMTQASSSGPGQSKTAS